jgi:glycosyltransferase involved in cell wall biosynthesis
MRLAVVASHPIQYNSPLFRALASASELTVFYAHNASAEDHARAGFDVGFQWDVDLLHGYQYEFLTNVAPRPGIHHFRGCDTPGLHSKLAAGHFDAVLVPGWHLKTYLQALIFAKRLGLPVLARGDSQLHTPRSIIKRAAKTIAYPPFLRLYDAALFVGRRSKEYWQRYHYPERRLFFSPHCVDNAGFAARARDTGPAFRSALGITQDERVLLFAGKLIALKRPLDVIEAAARVRQQGFKARVMIAGSGPLEQDLVAAARAKGVPLTMLGFCNQTAMPPAYAAADLLVLPSAHETWGLVANEALACGTPILLSSQVGAAPDLTADGMVGATYEVGDRIALASAAVRLLTSPPHPNAIRRKAEIYSVTTAVNGIVEAASQISRALR